MKLSPQEEIITNNITARRYPYNNLIHADSTVEMDYYDYPKDTLEKNVNKITKLRNLEMKYQPSNHYKTKIFPLENHLPTFWTDLTCQPEESLKVTEIPADKYADITTADLPSAGQQPAPTTNTLG